jgi:hypothetical protein
MLENAATVIAIERSGAFATWHPTAETVAAIHVPVALPVGRESPTFLGEMAGWPAPRLQVPVVTVPGRHGAYLDHASELTEALCSISDAGAPAQQPSPHTPRPAAHSH